MTPLQQAATALMDAMAQTDFTCRLVSQLDALEKALADEQAQQVSVPAGMALVPIEPTLEMMLKMPASSNSREWKEYYTAMLAAAQGAKP